jgi:hypothetical protein
MAGGLWRQLTSALQFLGLINQDKETQEIFKKIVKAHGSPEWKAAVATYVLPSYAKIVENLPIENGSMAQLEKCFKDHAKVDGQMLQKCIRFYLHALKESGTKHSTYFVVRQDKATTKRNGTANARRKKNDELSETRAQREPPPKAEQDPAKRPEEDRTPSGQFELKLPFKGKLAGCIRVPDDLTEEDFLVVKLTLEVLKAYATQGKKSATK